VRSQVPSVFSQQAPCVAPRFKAQLAKLWSSLIGGDI
jgi:hypothetical protein